MSSRIRSKVAAALIAATALGGFASMPSADAAPSQTFVAINKAGNRVLVIDAQGRVSRNRQIAGTNGEAIRAIDIRPNGGALYGVSTNHLYIIDAITGQAVQVGGDFAIPLEGEFIGIDFNPTVDRIRVVTSSGQDLRLNQTVMGTTSPTVDGNDGGTTPIDGVQPDGDLNYDSGDVNVGIAPTVVAAGYTNNSPTTGGTTQLYVVDAGTGVLAMQGRTTPTVVSPNTGTLFTVAPVSPTNTTAGLDIVFSGGVNTAYLGIRDGVNSKIFVLDLATGSTVRVLKITEKLGDIAAVLPA